MAAQLQNTVASAESAKLFQEALDLDSTLPQARAGVAQQKMASGKLDEARKLLDFLMAPGAAERYSLAPLYSLTGSLQQAGRHDEALKIAQILLREIPTLKDDKSFRAIVTRSEKALARPDSMVPKGRFSLLGMFRSQRTPSASSPPRSSAGRNLVIGTVAAILILVGLVGSNEFIRRHRTLHVLNATGQPAQVQVDSRPPVQISGMGQVIVEEGPHVVKVSGPLNETHNIPVASGYFERWLSQPVWLVNVGGEGVLAEITVVYSANGKPGERHLLVGEPFFYRKHVDYIFKSAPISSKSRTRVRRLRRPRSNGFGPTI